MLPLGWVKVMSNPFLLSWRYLLSVRYSLKWQASPPPNQLGAQRRETLRDPTSLAVETANVKFLIILFFYVNEIENEEKNLRPLPFRFVLFRFFPPVFVLFCWPRKQTSLFFAPIRLCHVVQANLHPSQEAWENKKIWCECRWPYMQSMVSQLWMFRSFANDLTLPSRVPGWRLLSQANALRDKRICTTWPSFPSSLATSQAWAKIK